MEMCIKAVKNSGGLPSHRHVDAGWWDSQRLVTVTAATDAAGNSKQRRVRIPAPVYNYCRWKRFRDATLDLRDREARRCFSLDFLPDGTQTTDAGIRLCTATQQTEQTADKPQNCRPQIPSSGIFKAEGILQVVCFLSSCMTKTSKVAEMALWGSI